MLFPLIIFLLITTTHVSSVNEHVPSYDSYDYAQRLDSDEMLDLPDTAFQDVWRHNQLVVPHDPDNPFKLTCAMCPMQINEKYFECHQYPILKATCERAQFCFTSQFVDFSEMRGCLYDAPLNYWNTKLKGHICFCNFANCNLFDTAFNSLKQDGNE